MVIDFTTCRRRRGYDIRLCPACGRRGYLMDLDSAAGPRTIRRVVHRAMALSAHASEILDECDQTALILPTG
jgi:hypothetical protein